MQTVQKTLQAEVTKLADFDGADVPVDVRQGTAYLNVVNNAGTNPTLDVDIQEKDETSGEYVTIASFVQVTDTDGCTKIAVSAIAAAVLRAVAAIGGTDSPSYTYSVGFSGKEGDEA